MKQMILWCLVAGLLGFAPQLLGASDLIEQAEAQALCNPHLKNSLNCTKKKRTTVNPKPKKPVVCVDDKVSSCLRTLDQGLREVADGGTVVVRPGLVHKRNIVISRPVVLCVGNTTTKRCSKAADILGRDIEVKGRTVPVNVFIIRPNDETKPCIDIRPRADSEVVISGVHVVASSKYRAGECVWQKSGTLRLMWSDLLGENTAVGMLALTGKSAHIEGNFIEGGQNGIKIFPPDPGTFVLLNNDVSHATTGIRVQGGSNVFGIGNKVHDNSGDGIVGLEGDAFYARNEVIHNRGSGLRFDRDRLTHSLPRTEAEVIGNTLDWNGRGEIRAEGEVVVVSAVNCVGKSVV